MQSSLDGGPLEGSLRNGSQYLPVVLTDEEDYVSYEHEVESVDHSQIRPLSLENVATSMDMNPGGNAAGGNMVESSLPWASQSDQHQPPSRPRTMAERKLYSVKQCDAPYRCQQVTHPKAEDLNNLQRVKILHKKDRPTLYGLGKEERGVYQVEDTEMRQLTHDKDMPESGQYWQDGARCGTRDYELAAGRRRNEDQPPGAARCSPVLSKASSSGPTRRRHLTMSTRQNLTFVENSRVKVIGEVIRLDTEPGSTRKRKAPLATLEDKTVTKHLRCGTNLNIATAVSSQQRAAPMNSDDGRSWTDPHQDLSTPSKMLQDSDVASAELFEGKLNWAAENDEGASSRDDYLTTSNCCTRPKLQEDVQRVLEDQCIVQQESSSAMVQANTRTPPARRKCVSSLHGVDAYDSHKTPPTAHSSRAYVSGRPARHYFPTPDGFEHRTEAEHHRPGHRSSTHHSADRIVLQSWAGDQKHVESRANPMRFNQSGESECEHDWSDKVETEVEEDLTSSWPQSQAMAAESDLGLCGARSLPPKPNESSETSIGFDERGSWPLTSQAEKVGVPRQGFDVDREWSREKDGKAMSVCCEEDNADVVYMEVDEGLHVPDQASMKEMAGSDPPFRRVIRCRLLGSRHWSSTYMIGPLDRNSRQGHRTCRSQGNVQGCLLEQRSIAGRPPCCGKSCSGLCRPTSALDLPFSPAGTRSKSAANMGSESIKEGKVIYVSDDCSSEVSSLACIYDTEERGGPTADVDTLLKPAVAGTTGMVEEPLGQPSPINREHHDHDDHQVETGGTGNLPSDKEEIKQKETPCPYPCHGSTGLREIIPAKTPWEDYSVSSRNVTMKTTNKSALETESSTPLQMLKPGSTIIDKTLGDSTVLSTCALDHEPTPFMTFLSPDKRILREAGHHRGDHDLYQTVDFCESSFGSDSKSGDERPKFSRDEELTAFKDRESQKKKMMQEKHEKGKAPPCTTKRAPPSTERPHHRADVIKGQDSSRLKLDHAVHAPSDQILQLPMSDPYDQNERNSQEPSTRKLRNRKVVLDDLHNAGTTEKPLLTKGKSPKKAEVTVKKDNDPTSSPELMRDKSQKTYQQTRGNKNATRSSSTCMDPSRTKLHKDVSLEQDISFKEPIDCPGQAKNRGYADMTAKHSQVEDEKKGSLRTAGEMESWEPDFRQFEQAVPGSRTRCSSPYSNTLHDPLEDSPVVVHAKPGVGRGCLLEAADSRQERTTTTATTGHEQDGPIDVLSHWNTAGAHQADDQANTNESKKFAIAAESENQDAAAITMDGEGLGEDVGSSTTKLVQQADSIEGCHLVGESPGEEPTGQAAKEDAQPRVYRQLRSRTFVISDGTAVQGQKCSPKDRKQCLRTGSAEKMAAVNLRLNVPGIPKCKEKNGCDGLLIRDMEEDTSADVQNKIKETTVDIVGKGRHEAITVAKSTEVEDENTMAGMTSENEDESTVAYSSEGEVTMVTAPDAEAESEKCIPGDAGPRSVEVHKSAEHQDVDHKKGIEGVSDSSIHVQLPKTDPECNRQHGEKVFDLETCKTVSTSASLLPSVSKTADISRPVDAAPKHSVEEQMQTCEVANLDHEMVPDDDHQRHSKQKVVESQLRMHQCHDAPPDLPECSTDSAEDYAEVSKGRQFIPKHAAEVCSGVQSLDVGDSVEEERETDRDSSCKQSEIKEGSSVLSPSGGSARTACARTGGRYLGSLGPVVAEGEQQEEVVQVRRLRSRVVIATPERHINSNRSGNSSYSKKTQSPTQDPEVEQTVFLRALALNLRIKPPKSSPFQLQPSPSTEDKPPSKHPEDKRDSFDKQDGRGSCCVESPMTKTGKAAARRHLLQQMDKCSSTQANASGGTPKQTDKGSDMCTTASDLAADLSPKGHTRSMKGQAGGTGDSPSAGAIACSQISVPEDVNYGKIVWARLGSERWWAAIGIAGPECGQMLAREEHSWIYWFGDHKVSEISQRKIIPFAVNFPQRYVDGKAKMYKRGVLEAIKECAKRAGNVDQSDESALLDWAQSGFPSTSTSLHNKGQLADWIKEDLVDMKEARRVAREDEGEEEEKKLFRMENLEKGTRLDLVRDGTLKIEDICISCEGSEVVMQHPYFDGGLCEDCKTELMVTMFCFGADATNVYCIICGNGGTLVVCDSASCSRVYCTGCIGCFVSCAAVKTITNIDQWQCFLCADHSPASHGLLQPKANWKQNIVNMFHPGVMGSLREPVPSHFERRPIRVLSLFDGIGTGKVILDGLNIKVDAYLACEIDADALMVTEVRHGDAVRQLGDVTLLDKVALLKLGPIDLLIGGSPCNDLSIVNPARKGLDGGTGLLFYEFFRILQELQIQSQQEGGRHLFWLFENVASMPAKYREKISRFFGCQPAMWDAKHFSAQHRSRLFWGNIPGMYCPQHNYPTESSDHSVDGVLMGNRKAAVTKLRTLTTRGNSLLQGKKDNIFPVRMGSQGDTLWIPELERVFGLPEHYTDVGNLPVTRRQKLLGQAWSVHVVQYLLYPLRQFYDLID